MKTCSCCNTEKPEEDFQVRKASKDGRTASCKQCLQKRDAARYPKEKVKRSALMKAYVATPDGMAAANAAKVRWKNKNTIKRAAHVLLGNRIADGTIVKPTRCSVCGKEGRIHGHHDDYAYQLIVRWLCAQCHTDWHKENGEGANAF